MDEELRQYLNDMETRIIKSIETRIGISEETTNDKLEQLETKLLSEFWKWGRTSDLRTRQAMGDIASINDRLLNVEDRVSSLERNKGAA